MRRHETPAEVASVLARHAPRRLQRVLDPAVGNGALLEPFFRRAKNSGFEIYAIDTDSRPLRRVFQKVSGELKSASKVVQADFLDWCSEYCKQRQPRLFDCIVMNPPFAARRQKWKPLSNLKQLDQFPDLPAAGPIEAAFLLSSVALLRPGGRLLAVLPASVVAAPNLAWLRQTVLATGSIHHVHELPRFTFSDIESRIYLLVFEKGSHQSKISLLNHDLLKPERMVIERSKLAPTQRLDFGYHKSAAKIRALKPNQTLGWLPLKELAKIIRGSEQTPNIPKHIIHTGHCRDGFWQREQPRPKNITGEKQIKPHDILVKRVSRNCARSFGLGHGIEGALASDCTMIIRPKHRISHIRLLFAIRSMMNLEFGPAFLERGTGAQYLSQSELLDFEVPYLLAGILPSDFSDYLKAVRRRCFRSMLLIERIAAEWLLTRSGR